ncbi:MAG TPA: DUF5615 family PIN-like protein [Bdellovibrionota bacterium]|nr:DUF5615 family PIN-like protein [Bdellovibrionota bacterium]
MKFLVDESVDKPIVDELRAEGHDVIYVAEQFAGLSDEAVFGHALDQSPHLGHGGQGFRGAGLQTKAASSRGDSSPSRRS